MSDFDPARAAAAAFALEAYSVARVAREARPPAVGLLPDLLVDLRHYCARERLDFLKLEAAAHQEYGEAVRDGRGS